jgi:hypothetical protein
MSNGGLTKVTAKTAAEVCKLFPLGDDAKVARDRRVLLDRLGNASSAILRENYDSVVAMMGLNEALERIDSSFQIAMSGQGDEPLQQQARGQYEQYWQGYRDDLKIEQNNITIAGEAQLVDQLTELTQKYRSQGDAFYAGPEIERLIQLLSRLPGLGPRSARRAYLAVDACCILR